MDISKSVIQYRLSHIIQLNENTRKRLVEKGTYTSLNVNSKNFDFCYKFFENHKNEKINQEHDTCIKGNGDKYLTVKTIGISKIMYNKNKDEAILFATVGNNAISAYKYFWAVLLKKTNGAWTVKSIGSGDYH